MIPQRLRPLVWGALLVCSAASAFAAEAKSAVPFLRDDYAKALATARAAKQPLFVEVWAPWCHSCRSMSAYVFPSPALRPYAARFAWASLDAERAENAAFRQNFVVEGFPSFYIIDPKDETIVVRWLGGATVEQLQQLLEDGLRAIHTPAEDRLGQALAKADQLYGAGKVKESAAAYEATLKLAPKNWNRLGRAVESWLFALQSSRQFEAGAGAALEQFPALRNTSSAVNLAAVGLDCALSLPKSQPKRTALIAALEKCARETLDNPGVACASDDRSGLFLTMISAREDAGDAAAVKALAAEWAAFLEGAAAQAPNPDARAVFDAHRLSAYLQLGQPERAIPMLIASEKDLPEDYNPPARLAVAHLALKQHDLALAAADRALAKVYGPRQLQILRTKADIQAAMGKVEDARATLRAALKLAAALPAGQRSERTIASLEEKLKALDNPAAR